MKNYYKTIYANIFSTGVIFAQILVDDGTFLYRLKLFIGYLIFLFIIFWVVAFITNSVE